MIDPVSLITDTYNRQARLYPALLLILPIVIGIVVFFPELVKSAQLLAVSSLGIGGAFLFTQLTRDAGKKREPELFHSWGGMPTIVIFRHQTKFIDDISKRRYHSKLALLVDGTRAVTQEEEELNPKEADKIYNSWSDYLRSKTRDPKIFGLLLKENINYGFRRNTLGVKPLGVTLSIVSLSVCFLTLICSWRSGVQIDLISIIGTVIILLLCFFWCRITSAEWVRISAFHYAKQLAESVDSLE